MLKTFSSKLVLAAGLVFASVAPSGLVALAGEDHPHEKGPNGGAVKGFGKYHIEGVRKGDKASFFLLGDDGKTAATIAKHEGGSITVIAVGKPQEKTDIPAGAGFSETSATVPAKGKVTVLVSIKASGKAASAKFNFAD